MNDYVVEGKADFLAWFLFGFRWVGFLAYIVNFGVVIFLGFNGFFRLSDFMLGDFIFDAIRAEANNAGKTQSRRKNGEKQ